MSNSLLIHIGHHKTASTFLQNLFKQSKEVNLLNDFVSPWNDELIKILISKEDYSIDKVRSIAHNRLEEGKKNIISAERLSGHPYSGGYDAELIRNRIKECFPDASIIIVKREVESFTLSVYKQMVKEGYCGKLTDFISTTEWKANQNRTKYLSQQPLIDNYLQNFDKVLILEFEGLVRSETDFLKSLADFIGCDLTVSGSKRINPPWPNRRINGLRYLNRFRKTELNPFPCVHLPQSLLFKLSWVFQFLCSNRIK